MKKNLKLYFHAHWLLPVLFLATLLVSSEPARAQSTLTDFLAATTPGTDVSYKTFYALLGPIFNSPLTAVGGASTLLGSLFLVYNTFVFFVAMVWAGYGMLSSAVQTAHEGVALGRNMSPVWMPIRLTIGIAGMFPVFGGFSVSQGVMLFATTLGIGAANFMTDKALTATSQFQALVPMSIGKAPVGGAFIDATETIFIMKVCSLAMAEEMAAGAVAGNAAQDVPQVITPTGPGVVAGVMYGTLAKPGLCGSVRVVDSYKTGYGATSPIGFRSGAVNYDEINAAVKLSYQTGFLTMRTSAEALATTWYQQRQVVRNTPNAANPDLATPRQALNQIAFDYATRITADSTTATGQGESKKKAISDSAMVHMKELGWFGLGTWSSVFSEVGAAIREASTKVSIESEAPSISGASSTVFDALKAVGRGDAKAREKSPETQSWLTNITGNWSLGQFFVNLMINQAGGTAGADMVDPITAMKNLGDGLLMVADTALMGKPVSKMASAFMSPAGTVIEAGADAAGALISGADTPSKSKGRTMSMLGSLGSDMGEGMGAIWPTILGLMFAMGIFMSVYVPMLPFISWAGALVGYVTSVLEGLAAAPVWSLAHMEAQGEGLGQRSQQGYLFLINMLMRPPLMVFAFFFASGLMVAMGTFVTTAFAPAMANAQGNSITGLASILGYLIVYGVLMWSIIQGLTNLYHLIPDQVIGWVGGSMGSRLGTEVQDKVNSLFVGYGRTVSGAVQPKAFKTPGAVVAPGKPGLDKPAPGGGAAGGAGALK